MDGYVQLKRNDRCYGRGCDRSADVSPRSRAQLVSGHSVTLLSLPPRITVIILSNTFFYLLFCNHWDLRLFVISLKTITGMNQLDIISLLFLLLLLRNKALPDRNKLIPQR